jgi:GNAT superfamily N-acetyltransferase
MNITIRPLTPELSGDYFDFFENRAFTDDSPYRCYCQPYQMTKEQAETVYDNVDGPDIGRVARKIAERQIDSGALQGYLAFLDGISIGWCNANDKVNYPIESCNGARFQMSTEKREKGRVKIVACFEIAPEYRMKGVATALLARVCEDAKTEGYIAVEGFPFVLTERYEWDNCGPIRLYQKVGFVKMAEQDNVLVMRNDLQECKFYDR